MHKTGLKPVLKNKPGRLQKRPEFLCVASQGKKWVSDSVIVQYHPVTEGGDFRYGVTATKKLGNAVIRNRCKRRLRAAMDELFKEIDLYPADVVLIARPATITGDWEKLIKDLRWCFKRLEAYQRNT